ncbi:hypothetical protein B296_00042146 [Ensete ventricosum]|uniref:Uncharacterized protein n=1 Tax=Ensete ventricosum TaxID=4639 RepID=A0A426YAU8_ENSVE|nr:hypothetical protein B296_00042146 [Ensete ventricosum]
MFSIDSRRIILHIPATPEDACREATYVLGHEGSARGQTAFGRGQQPTTRPPVGAATHGQALYRGDCPRPRATARKGRSLTGRSGAPPIGAIAQGQGRQLSYLAYADSCKVYDIWDLTMPAAHAIMHVPLLPLPPAMARTTL